MDLLLIIFGALVVIIFVVVISRANELFYVSIRNGRCIVVRGHLSPSLWSELRAVVRMTGARRGSVRGIKDGGQPRLVIHGLDDGSAQRLRNAFGARGFARVTASGNAAPSASTGSRNLGQLLGIAWLAWLFAGRN